MGQLASGGRFSLSSIRVSHKIYGVLGFLIASFALTGGVTLWQMSSISAEINAISDRQMPLTESVSTISLNQLEQAIYFERMLRVGSSSGASQGEELKKLIAAFEKDGRIVEEQLSAAEEIAASAANSSAAPSTLARYEAILASLKHFHDGHKLYEKHAADVIARVRRGELAQVPHLVDEILEEEEKLDHEIAEILVEIEHLMADSLKTVKAHEETALWIVVVMTLAAISVGTVVALLIVRGIVGPLRNVVDALGALSTGDTQSHVEVRGTDEIGQTARAYGLLRKMTEDAQVLAAKQELLEKQAKKDRQELVDRLTTELETSVGSVLVEIEQAAQTLAGTSHDMLGAAEAGKTQTSTVSASIEETSTNVQIVASAAEEMAASITEVSNTIAKTAQVTQLAVADAERTNKSVTSLAEAASRIGDVVNLISDIADQTNLLALNATIEAARAGEAGKGFAVVASEVKDLANQTANATAEISAQISEIQSVTDSSVEAISGITKTITEIDEYSSVVSSSIEEQKQATHEISGSVQQAATGTQELSQAMQGVQQTADLTGDVASRVDSAVTDLSEQANSLKGHLNNFLDQVRTA